MRPVVSAAGEDLYAYLGALAHEDEENDWQLLLFADAWATMVEPLFSWVSDSDDFVGWSRLFNADEAPPGALPYLAQFVGARLLQGLTEEQIRDTIKTHAGFERGTSGAVVAATKRYLLEPKRVQIRERFGFGADHPYRLFIRVYTPDVIDRAAVVRSILEQKPGAIRLDFDVIDGQTYDDLQSRFATYDDVDAEYDSYEELRTDIP